MTSGAVAIGPKCVSWVLNPGHRLKRIALATNGAAEKLKGNFLLQSRLKNDPPPTHPELLKNAGFSVEGFIGRNRWLTFGIHLFNSIADSGHYQEGIQRLISVEQGIHRRVNFAIMGIKVSPTLDELREDLYWKMLGKIRCDHGEGGLRNIAAIDLTEEPFPTVSRKTEAGLEITFSKPLLARLTEGSYLTGVGLTFIAD